MDYSKGIGYVAMLLLKDTNPTWVVKVLRWCLVTSGVVATVYGIVWAANQMWLMQWRL